MEIILLFIILLLMMLITYLLWKNATLKKDIYSFANQLNYNLDKLIKEDVIDPIHSIEDDLWGKVNNKLVQVSTIHTEKKASLYDEKMKLKELTSDISHQIKTPIANIKLYLEIISEEQTSEENRMYLEKTMKQVDKLEFLFNSLVKISRLETGTIKILKTPTRIQQTLVSAIEVIILKADEKNIRVSVDYEESVIINHDSKWTSEAIANILDNAVKYTGINGTINITITQQAIFTKVSIQDTGKGISIQRQASIFKRFYREPEVHDSDGIGVGLYLARNIIELQNGYIEVQSQVGKGSTFIIYLPN